jgi:hypothetical protein
MKRIWVLIAVVVLSLVVAGPALAMDGHDCNGDMTTISSLHHCVDHALAMGYIDRAGVAASLHAELDAAQAALDRGQTDVATNLLDAFILQVSAQSGKHIDADHAAHMIHHAEMVQMALGGM